MLKVEHNLFEGKTVRLAALDLENDPKVEAAWCEDLDYAEWFTNAPTGLLSPAVIRKYYEEKTKGECPSSLYFIFNVRKNEDDSAVGKLMVHAIEWQHSTATLNFWWNREQLNLAGAGEILELGLNYCFSELNLFRLETRACSCDSDRITLLKQAGLVEEACQAAAIYRNGKTWDRIHFGMLRDEWLQNKREELE